MKERSLADDLAVYIANPREGLPRLRVQLERFGAMSGQKINTGKSQIALLGKDEAALENLNKGGAEDPNTWWQGMRYTRKGLEIEKYHGIKLATNEQIGDQWDAMARDQAERLDTERKVFV